MKNGADNTDAGDHEQEHTTSDDTAHHRDIHNVRTGLRVTSDPHQHKRNHL